MHIVNDVQKDVQKTEPKSSEKSSEKSSDKSSGKGLTNKVALITGGSRRIGAAIVRQLHATGMRVVVHYHHSETAAHALQPEMNNQRSESVLLYQAD